MLPIKRAAKPKASEGASLSLRVMADGLASAKLGLGVALLERLGKDWQVGQSVTVSLGSGADRGWLRLALDPEGAYRIVGMSGRGRGAGVIALGRNAAWATDRGKWKIPPADITHLDEDGFTVRLRLPPEALSRVAKAVS
jgi:hypothetical protein